MSFKINTLAALTLALAAFAQPASAAERFTQRSVTISSADLNLASATGAKQLYKRINRAAETACGPRPSGFVLQVFPSARREYKSCVRDAVENAVTSLNNPLVTAYHNGGKRAMMVAAAEYVR